MKKSRSAFETELAITLHSNYNQYIDLYESTQKFLRNNNPEDNYRYYVLNYASPLLGLRINVYLTSFALIESFIDLYLSLQDPIWIKNLDNLPTINKWMIIPKIFNKEYFINEEGQLYEDLKLLNTTRNCILHNKPTIEFEDETITKGSNIKYTEDHDFCLNVVTLPYRLLENLRSYDDSFIDEIGLIVFEYLPQ